MDTQTAGRLVGTPEAAQLLGVGPTTIHRWVARGLLTPAVPGRRLLFDPTTLRRPEPLLGVPQVADRLGISDVLVRRLVDDGRLEAVWTGNRARFRAVDVERFVSGLPADPVDIVPLAHAAAQLGTSPPTLIRHARRAGIELVTGLDGGRHVRQDDLEHLRGHLGPPRPRAGEDDLTTGDVAVILARSREWVRQRAIAGQIPHRVTPGGRRRFRLQDLQPRAPADNPDPTI